MLLDVKNLKKDFIVPDGSKQAVVNLDYFGLGSTEQISFEGGSGTGKTTFLNLIAGVLQADSGRISIDGSEISSLSESKRDELRAQKIGYIFQTFNLLQGITALENVVLSMAFGKGADEPYALDEEAERSVSISQEEMLFEIDSPAKLTVNLVAVENALTGEKRGATSEFLGQNSRLKNVSEFEGRVKSITIRGRHA